MVFSVDYPSDTFHKLFVLGSLPPKGFQFFFFDSCFFPPFMGVGEASGEAVFSSTLKAKVGSTLTKAAALRITLNIQY